MEEIKTTNEKLWFKAKRYGWGWTPATWEGWTVTLGYAGLFTAGMIVFTNRIEQHHGAANLIAYLGFVLAITSTLIWISYKKGEPPRWRWGSEEK